MILRYRRLAATWTVAVPILAVAVLALAWGRTIPIAVVVIAALFLASAVLAAVHHAEVIAHRVGEPFGSLVLAVAVTVIEVALIISLTVSGGPAASSLARDTVFAAVMITCNGIVGLSLLIAALRRRVAVFNAEGTGGALATVATLSTMSLVLPAFTTSKPGPAFAPAQLAFAALVSIALYGLFVLTQAVRHRDYFLPVEPGTEGADAARRAKRPAKRSATASLALLLTALVAVVGLAKVESPAIEAAVRTARLPQAVVGVVIALLVLLPETLAAVRAARRARVQVSLNLAFGSAMASIGLTIPTIAAASLWLEGPLLLGLDPTHIVLLGLTIVVATLTVVPGRATVLQAGVHLTLFAAFLLLAVSP
ncbi:ionic transporter y4hA [Microbispora rosea subsp. aerata]|nr:ionic transporter y4hA [Microbispora rosea]GGO12877.1 ionic transporter y4hA [Microbispora rosea subsp. aerata]GIH54152.1 ionic transporter y4hA [Microbispora rosea subsp. aerata]GLJ85126.1 ionic transporter y4hA [Microbispora rosea subsp. aerata]